MAKATDHWMGTENRVIKVGMRVVPEDLEIGQREYTCSEYGSVISLSERFLLVVDH